VRWLINTQIVLNQCSINATHDVWIYDLYWGLLYVVPVVKTVAYTKWYGFCGPFDRDLHVLFEFGVYALLICMSGSYSYYTRSKDIVYIFVLSIAVLVLVLSYIISFISRQYMECVHGARDCATTIAKDERKRYICSTLSVMDTLDTIGLILFFLWSGVLGINDQFISNICSTI